MDNSFVKQAFKTYRIEIKSIKLLKIFQALDYHKKLKLADNFSAKVFKTIYKKNLKKGLT